MGIGIFDFRNLLCQFLSIFVTFCNLFLEDIHIDIVKPDNAPIKAIFNKMGGIPFMHFC